MTTSKDQASRLVSLASPVKCSHRHESLPQSISSRDSEELSQICTLLRRLQIGRITFCRSRPM